MENLKVMALCERSIANRNLAFRAASRRLKVIVLKQASLSQPPLLPPSSLRPRIRAVFLLLVLGIAPTSTPAHLCE
jgi:hypothetical protein